MQKAESSYSLQEKNASCIAIIAGGIVFIFLCADDMLGIGMADDALVLPTMAYIGENFHILIS